MTEQYQTVISVPSIPQNGNPAAWGMHLSDVGGLTGAILGALFIFGYALSRFRKDTTINSSEANLYKNLSDRIEVISKSLIKVEQEREFLLVKVANAEAKIAKLEQHERENELLRIRLEEKDKIIKALQEGSEVKQAEIADLQNRIHELELQMKQKFVDCAMCDHKRVSETRTRRTDDCLSDIDGKVIGDEL